jgi:hypothetical protein
MSKCGHGELMLNVANITLKPHIGLYPMKINCFPKSPSISLNLGSTASLYTLGLVLFYHAVANTNYTEVEIILMS